MMEVIEHNLKTESLKSPIQDEFFDAEDKEVESAKEEDDDFMQKLDIAINRSESPPAKRRCSEEVTATNPPKSVTENGDEKNALPLSKDSIDVEKSEDSRVTNILSKPVEEITDSDAEKIENDLLKDLDDDHNDDLDSVCEEVQDLVDSILESDDNQKESTESNIIEKKGQNQSTATVNEESEKKEDDGSVTSPDVAPEKAIKSLDSVFDDLFAEETTKVKENKPDADSVTPQDDVSPQDGKADESECVILPEEEVAAASPTEPSTNLEMKLDDDAEQDLKAEDLLVACESPKDTRRVEDQNQQENSSESSSSAGDAPEDSSDCDKQTAEDTSNDGVKINNVQPEVEQLKPTPNETAPDSGKSDQMEVDDEATAEDDPIADEPKTPTTLTTDPDDEEHLCIVLEKETQDELEPVAMESTAEFIPLKLKFMRKFSSATGKLSRPELEELLIEKITESLMFCSDNTDLRARLEKQEKISEAFKKRLDNVKKQYNDLEMIHNRVMKDLKDRPNAAITPVKITRAVGLQVYQPVPRSKLAPPMSVTQHSLIKTSNKRQLESESTVNGKGLSPENAKRKKMLKITPLRPPLSDKERASVDRQEAKEEQKLRSNVSMNIVGGISSVAIPPSVTMTPVPATNGSKKTSETMHSSASIDLTDDIEEGNSTSMNSKVATPPFQQPPALVAIRGTNQSNVSQPNRNAFIIKPTIVSANICKSSPDVVKNTMLRTHPAPLPPTPSQILKPGQKKIPPRPSIKINNVQSGIIVSWTVDNFNQEHAEIHSYQIYAYEVTSSPPSSENWRHVGDVKALLLPMAVTLTQFQEGQKYFFAVRAVDAHKRLGQFSPPRTWGKQ